MDAELEAREEEEFRQHVGRELDEEALREMDGLPPQLPMVSHRPRQSQVAGAGAVQAAAVPPMEPRQQSPLCNRAQPLQAACGDEDLKPLFAAARRPALRLLGLFDVLREDMLVHGVLRPAQLLRDLAYVARCQSHGAAS